MKIDCIKWRELASDYIEGTLPSEMQTAVIAHLKGCDNCRQDEVVLRAMSRELNVLPEVDPPLFFRENVMAAIERQGRHATENWWQSLWTSYGRFGIGAGLTAGVAVALTFAVMSQQNPNVQKAQVGAVPVTTVASPSPAATRPQPELHLSHVSTVVPGGEMATDFSFHLENADKGSARFSLGEDNRVFRFDLTGTAPQTLRIPATTLAEKKVLELRAEWTVAGTNHTRILFLPTPSTEGTVSESRQSFGLPEENVAAIARDIAVRYAEPITLDDVPESMTVRVTAKDETAEQVLQRELATANLSVVKGADGLHITPNRGNIPVQP